MRTPETPFVPAPKTPRLSREVIVTEKLDGCRGAIVIDDSGELFAASRNRWLDLKNDNYCFARWCEERKEELLKLGPGRHEGEFWGLGIQRNYGLSEKRFSLFNASRWANSMKGYGIIELRPDAPSPGPECCSVVPIIYRGEFCTQKIDDALLYLRGAGSVAAPGFRDPEGIVVYHTAAGICFKKTIKNDETPKSFP